MSPSPESNVQNPGDCLGAARRLAAPRRRHGRTGVIRVGSFSHVVLKPDQEESALDKTPAELGGAFSQSNRTQPRDQTRFTRGEPEDQLASA